MLTPDGYSLPHALSHGVSATADTACDVYAIGGHPLTTTNQVTFTARGASRLVSGASQGLLT